MTCKTHPDAPHGFLRNASHSEGRYVCECEHWEPPDPLAVYNDERLVSIYDKQQMAKSEDKTAPCIQAGRMNDQNLIFRLEERARIRRQIPGRKSVEEGTPDRIADLLEEAAQELRQARDFEKMVRRMGDVLE
jgi:hypothetical protein